MDTNIERLYKEWVGSWGDENYKQPLTKSQIGEALDCISNYDDQIILKVLDCLNGVIIFDYYLSEVIDSRPHTKKAITPKLKILNDAFLLFHELSAYTDRDAKKDSSNAMRIIAQTYTDLERIIEEINYDEVAYADPKYHTIFNVDKRDLNQNYSKLILKISKPIKRVDVLKILSLQMKSLLVNNKKTIDIFRNIFNVNVSRYLRIPKEIRFHTITIPSPNFKGIEKTHIADRRSYQITLPKSFNAIPLTAKEYIHTSLSEPAILK